MGGAYYNEFDPGAAAWLRELMRAGLIADGEVDERSILDVSADDVRGFTQCHWFAGIGGWSYALRLAGWPDDRPVWTGSPPCQPFSVAGKQKGRDDERHLAPHFVDLVRAARPGMLFGEQVASSDVFGKAAKRARGNFVAPPQWAWLDDLSDRLEAARYAVGASDFPSAGVGAPHIRQRTYFGAVAHEWLEHASRNGRIEWGTEPSQRGAGIGRGACGLADFDSDGSLPGAQRGIYRGQEGSGSRDGEPERFGADGGVADDQLQQRQVATGLGYDPRGWQQESAAASRLRRNSRPCPLHGFWRDSDWLFCRDGKWRPVEPAVLGLVDGLPGCVVSSGPFVPASYPIAQGGKDARRVMRLRGYGNAINPHAAAEFIQAFNAVIEGREWMVEPTAITPPFPQQMSLFS